MSTGRFELAAATRAKTKARAFSRCSESNILNYHADIQPPADLHLDLVVTLNFESNKR
jgi:hypothetical protein